MRGARPGVLVGAVAAAGLLLGSAPRARATVEMQAEARRLGFGVRNCLYCHSSPHAAEVMKKRAQALGVSEGNCMLCHGARIPAALNDRGRWLVQQKARRQARATDMSWLKDYTEGAAPLDDKAGKKITPPKDAGSPRLAPD